jgi:hypothetical protein
MAAITPSASVNMSIGNRVGIGASFTTIQNADTWQTGLGTVEGVVITDSVSGHTFGATYVAGGQIIFYCSGDLSNARVLAIGLP